MNPDYYNGLTFEEIKENCKRNVGIYSPRVVLGIINHFERQVKYLEEGKELLLRQIEREVEGQKPAVLPAKVAEAIDKLRAAGWSTADLLNAIEFMDSMWEPVIQSGHPGFPIAKYLAEGNILNYAQALINGYTVETLESKIRGAVLKLVEERSERNVGYIIANDSEDFSQEITELVTQIIREDQLQSG